MIPPPTGKKAPHPIVLPKCSAYSEPQPVPGVPHCVGCQAHVISQPSDVHYLLQSKNITNNSDTAAAPTAVVTSGASVNNSSVAVTASLMEEGWMQDLFQAASALSYITLQEREQMELALLAAASNVMSTHSQSKEEIECMWQTPKHSVASIIGNEDDDEAEEKKQEMDDELDVPAITPKMRNAATENHNIDGKNDEEDVFICPDGEVEEIEVIHCESVASDDDEDGDNSDDEEVIEIDDDTDDEEEEIVALVSMLQDSPRVAKGEPVANMDKYAVVNEEHTDVIVEQEEIGTTVLLTDNSASSSVSDSPDKTSSTASEKCSAARVNEVTEAIVTVDARVDSKSATSSGGSKTARASNRMYPVTPRITLADVDGLDSRSTSSRVSFASAVISVRKETISGSATSRSASRASRISPVSWASPVGTPVAKHEAASDEGRSTPSRGSVASGASARKEAAAKSVIGDNPMDSKIRESRGSGMYSPVSEPSLSSPASAMTPGSLMSGKGRVSRGTTSSFVGEASPLGRSSPAVSMTVGNLRDKQGGHRATSSVGEPFPQSSASPDRPSTTQNILDSKGKPLRGGSSLRDPSPQSKSSPARSNTDSHLESKGRAPRDSPSFSESSAQRSPARSMTAEKHIESQSQASRESGLQSRVIEIFSSRSSLSKPSPPGHVGLGAPSSPDVVDGIDSPVSRVSMGTLADIKNKAMTAVADAESTSVVIRIAEEEKIDDTLDYLPEYSVR
jgi:hypothetical protein